MKLYRGIFTRLSRERALESMLVEAEIDQEGWSQQLISKIINNEEAVPFEEKLTSFSTDREIAARYSGGQGWVIEIEIDPKWVVFPLQHLESALAKEIRGTDNYTRVSEALEMSAADSEVFIVKGASYEISDTWMMGGLSLSGE